MLPRLEAEEKLAAVHLAALSHNVGYENDLDRQRILAGLEQRASGEGARAPQKADPQDLAGMGIGVRMVEGEGDVIADRAAWLGIEGDPSSSSAAVGHQNG